jgi:putative effector of murein hydrolase LrgA (UPF0299 family)
MHALQGLAILLTLQSAGVVLSRLLHLPYPGPVVGMVLLLLALRWPAVQTRVGAVATFLLSHLSLLFVPVGVGLIAQLGLLGQHGLRLMVVVVVSTWVGLGVTAWVLQWLLRRAPQAQAPTSEGSTPHE